MVKPVSPLSLGFSDLGGGVLRVLWALGLFCVLGMFGFCWVDPWVVVLELGCLVDGCTEMAFCRFDLGIGDLHLFLEIHYGCRYQ